MKISCCFFVIDDMITQEKIQKPYIYSFFFFFLGGGGGGGGELVGEEGDKLPKFSN